MADGLGLLLCSGMARRSFLPAGTGLSQRAGGAVGGTDRSGVEGEQAEQARSTRANAQGNWRFGGTRRY